MFGESVADRITAHRADVVPFGWKIIKCPISRFPADGVSVSVTMAGRASAPTAEKYSPDLNDVGAAMVSPSSHLVSV